MCICVLAAYGCGGDDGIADGGDAGVAVDSAVTDTSVGMDAGPRPDAGPSVLDDLLEGQWMVLSENVLEDVNPCPDGSCPYRGNSGIGAVMSAWCGAAFASEWGLLGGLVLGGGGHQDYYGSEIYVFDVATRRWERATDPYDGGTADCDETTGSYPDGSPCPSHTYDGTAYDPTTNSYIVLNSETNNLGGYTSGHPYTLDLDTRTWSRGPRREGGSGGTGINSAWDSNRTVLWTLPANGGDFQYFDPNADTTGQWTSFGRNDIAIDAIASIAPTRDLYVILDTRGAQALAVFDLASPTEPRVTVSTDGAASDVLTASKPSLEWDPIGARFVIWIEGTSIYTLDVPAGDWRTEPWTFTRVDPAAGNAVDPGAANSNGTYSRFRYVPSKDVFIVVSNTDAPVYAYRPAR